jgi:hypothetical protein
MNAIRKTASASDVQRRLLVVVLASVAVFVATFLYATSPTTRNGCGVRGCGTVRTARAVAVSIVLLLQNRLRGKRAAG